MFFSAGALATRGHPIFIFRSPGGVCDLQSLLYRFDALPRIRYVVTGIDCAAEIVEKKPIGLAMFRIATAAVRDYYNAKRLEFTKRSRDLPPGDAVFHELRSGDDEFAVVVSAMTAQFQFNSQQRQMCILRQGAEGRTFQQFHGSRRKMLRYVVATNRIAVRTAFPDAAAHAAPALSRAFA
jgi:hypothetical protein